MASQSRLPFLLTRPAAQGKRFAADLATRFGPGIRVVTSPLLAPVFLSPDLPTAAQTLVFTSETGVEGFKRISAQHPGLPNRAWCVGERTTQAARSAGLDARSADGDADALIARIIDSKECGPFLHLRGMETRGDVAKRLAEAGFSATDAIIYDQRPQSVTGEALTLLRGADPVVTPLFSPRTAALLGAAVQAEAPQARLWVAALSPAVLAAIGLQPERTTTATHPDAASLIDAIAALIDAESHA